jgi:two-component system phosphate regulon response regulator OmpR
MIARLLVCDDEPDVREMFAEYLGRRGFSVETAADAVALRAAVGRGGLDLILLDITMPGEDGLSALRALRAAGARVPVVMLTARGEVVDRVIGIEMGADDYLGKPVDLRELEARIKAVLRRTSPELGEAPAPAGRRWRFGKCWLDTAAAKLLADDGSEVPLTAMEFNLLKLFAENRGRVLNRDQILEGAHDRAWDPYDRSIDIRISRIRRKIEVNPEKPVVIRTVRGLGYLYDPK